MMVWTILSFGKHKGKSLPQVIFRDPDWFFWGHEQKIFKGGLAAEARDVYKKARSIRIPDSGSEPQIVEYYIHPNTGKFANFHVLPESTPRHEGASPTLRRNVIDLGIPREIAGYDKLGGSLMLADLKYYVFGDSNFRMTKKRCEDFFENQANFELEDGSS